MRWSFLRKSRAAKGFRALRLTSSFHISRRRSPFARQEPLHRTRILPKPRRLRRFSISDARFALSNIKRDIAESESAILPLNYPPPNEQISDFRRSEVSLGSKLSSLTTHFGRVTNASECAPSDRSCVILRVKLRWLQLWLRKRNL